MPRHLRQDLMTPDTYADLFDEDLDEVCGSTRLGHRSRCGRAADGSRSLMLDYRFDLLKLCGAKGNRTPDLLDANESRYQLRHSP